MIVVPTYNEARNISRLIPHLLAYPRVRVLVIDDNSPDGTGDAVAALALREPRVALQRRPGKLGLGSAYIAGFQRALAEGAEFIFEMDADFSHNPHYVPKLLAMAEAGADLVIGSRYVHGGGTSHWSFWRQLVSRGGNLYARMLLGLPVADVTGGFRCYRRRVIETLDLGRLRSHGYAFQIELLYHIYQAGYSIVETPIIFPDRQVGSSKMSRRIMAEALINVWRLRFEPLSSPLGHQAVTPRGATRAYRGYTPEDRGYPEQLPR
jgi:dolichol-phosphate mannosyltransferase